MNFLLMLHTGKAPVRYFFTPASDSPSPVTSGLTAGFWSYTPGRVTMISDGCETLSQPARCR